MRSKFIVYSFAFCLPLQGALAGCVECQTDKGSMTTNSLVSIKVVSKFEDTSLPLFTTICRPQAEFISSKVYTANVAVDCKICIKNNSKWTYGFGTPYSFTGYYCLEFDLLLDNGNTIVLKRRKPKYLSDKGEVIRILPQKGREFLISLDSRLWNTSSEISTNKVLKIRPRFAFGAFIVDGKYYRTSDEAEKRQKKARTWDDRDGELVGQWVDFWKNNQHSSAVSAKSAGD